MGKRRGHIQPSQGWSPGGEGVGRYQGYIAPSWAICGWEGTSPGRL